MQERDPKPLAQIVLSGNTEAPDLDLVPNVERTAPRAFEDEAMWVPRLGSSAFVDLVAALREQGAGIIGFGIAGASGVPIDNSGVSRALVEALDDEGVARARSLLAVDYRDKLILGFEARMGPLDIELGRLGAVRTNDIEAAERMLRRVWRSSGPHR